MNAERSPATGCAELVAAVEAIGASGATGRTFLARLARDAAAIRPGIKGLFDLAAGGYNAIKGRGFHARYDDGSHGQARHFAGIAYSTGLIGARATRWVSMHVRRDPTTSPDGRLTDIAIEFAGQILDGSLDETQAAAWVSHHVCASDG